MTTTVGTEDKLVDLFNDLIQLDFDAAGAYRSAIDRLEDHSLSTTLKGFLADHERHTQNLRPLVTKLGGTPSEEGDSKAWLTTGKIAMADMMGDRAILKAMKTNEDDTNTAYERAANHKDLTPEAQTVLEQNLGDERRHRAWMEETINSMK